MIITIYITWNRLGRSVQDRQSFQMTSVSSTRTLGHQNQTHAANEHLFNVRYAHTHRMKYKFGYAYLGDRASSAAGGAIIVESGGPVPMSPACTTALDQNNLNSHSQSKHLLSQNGSCRKNFNSNRVVLKQKVLVTILHLSLFYSSWNKGDQRKTAICWSIPSRGGAGIQVLGSNEPNKSCKISGKLVFNTAQILFTQQGEPNE